ncbi:uncharacterized protein LOC112559993 [Pomacea canaliculata]|uniref:uncharacterized protein LOC112559993 n=1 Tax=Pomacea canaliculata TaxID=400727 RepID=UPI000D735B33|nr:uncharacterized protein LOC112559993 [Pomacea canaliculata]
MEKPSSTGSVRKQSVRTVRRDTRLSYQLEREDLAGPMTKSDTLHFVTLFFATVALGLSLCAMIGPGWFEVYEKNTETTDEAYSTTVYKLWDLGKCSESEIICFDSEEKTSTLEFHLGIWVFVVQLLLAAGICLVFVNIIMQLLNTAMSQRSQGIQNTSMIIIGAAGCFFVMGSGVGQYHALWKGPLRDDEGNFMAVDTLPCGLILLSVACCAACGVFTHVASHGAGAVSRETRFLYRRKTLEVSAMMRPSTTGREPGLDRIKNLT